MRIDIITLFPEMMEIYFRESILRRAQEKKCAEIYCHQLRDFAVNKHRQVDDAPYGGSAGMVLMAEPLDRCISGLKEQRDYDEVIFLTPDGETHTQQLANSLSVKKNILLICGRYKGIDQRIRDMHVTREISIGDYVLTGGELAAAVVCDSIVRLLPGVLNDEQSALSDTFQDHLLAPPLYTRPAEYKGMKVPDVLLSGNFAKINEWEYQQALKRTEERRPDLLRNNKY